MARIKLAVVGGKLQGVEAVYLAKKAGWETLLLDRDENAPAAGLCDRFLRLDAFNHKELAEALAQADAVLPAIEDDAVLDAVQVAADSTGTPFFFDRSAYDISKSKLRSDTLFAELGLDRPVSWPECGFPVIAKPSGQSGSKGVMKIECRPELDRLSLDAETTVLQQYLPGRSFSIEVVGDGVNYVPLQVTELFMDDTYDCSRVVAPALISRECERKLEEMALIIARALNIRGIFDVETIFHEGRHKVLEIDARLPSQTPIAVYHSCGVNMLELLAGVYLDGAVPKVDIQPARKVILEHVSVTDGAMSVCGEHIMSGKGRLKHIGGFYGAEEALTSYSPSAGKWVATLIHTGACQAPEKSNIGG